MMKLLTSLFNKLDWTAPLISRLTLGFIFVQSGWGKFQHLDNVVQFFSAIGIPAAHVQAPFVAGVELVCGALVAVGLFTRLAAMPLIGTMVVAIYTVKLEEVGQFSDFLSFSEYLFIVLLLWLIVKGAGALSLDRIFCKKTN